MIARSDSHRHGIADLDETIGLIYEAALDPTLWPAVLGRITGQGGATCTLMLVLEPGTARPLHLLFDQWPGLADYVDYYAAIDPRNAYGAQPYAGTKVVDYDFTTEAEMARSEFYQDYLLPNDMGYVGAGLLARDSNCVAGIAMQRSRRQGPFEPDELDLLDRLTPHLARALRLQTRFAALETQRWTDQALRDRLPFAVILVDECGRIVSQNQAATNLLAAADGLTARWGRLCAAHPTDQACLDRLIRNASTPTNGDAPVGGAGPLRRPSLRRPLNLFVMPIPRRGSAFSLDLGTPAPAALVIVSDPERATDVPGSTLRHLYGLTPSEMALARALAVGKNLQEYAEEAEVTRETARWRLKQVLAKTETRRQAELVRLVLTNAVLG